MMAYYYIVYNNKFFFTNCIFLIGLPPLPDCPGHPGIDPFCPASREDSTKDAKWHNVPESALKLGLGLEGWLSLFWHPDLSYHYGHKQVAATCCLHGSGALRWSKPERLGLGFWGRKMRPPKSSNVFQCLQLMKAEVEIN